MTRVVLDATGGDLGIEPNVDGAIGACAKWQDVNVTLVGPKRALEYAFSRRKYIKSNIQIKDAPDIITMSDPAIAPLRHKPLSSIRIGIDILKNGEADIFVSAGNTGAVMATAKVLLGTIEGIERPAIAAPLPTRFGIEVLIDVGANVDCKAFHLCQFAVMGSSYAQITGIASPRVALLSIGEEAQKGTDVTRTVHKELKKANMNFIGNIDGKDVFSGVADVIVCDGFIGNVVLKISEGLAETIEEVMKGEFAKSRIAQLGYLLSRSTYKKIRKRLDYAEYGGAPLLGLNGSIVICHGRSNARAIKNAIGVALECHLKELPKRIKEGIVPLTKINQEINAKDTA